MRRHIDMKEPAACILNNHKHIEDTKGYGDHHAEITCDDTLGVIADKRGPSLRGGTLAWATDAVIRHVFAYCSWRDLQAKFEQQLVGEAFLSPGRIFHSHAADQGL
jgi:hypothetical protein